jgi:hypothetical protein
MQKKPSVSVVGVPVHVIQRGNNRQVIFAGDGDMKAYVTWLKEYADKFYVAIHAWVLMTNQVTQAPTVILFNEHVGVKLLDDIRQAANKGMILGSKRFVEEVEVLTVKMGNYEDIHRNKSQNCFLGCSLSWVSC